MFYKIAFGSSPNHIYNKITGYELLIYVHHKAAFLFRYSFKHKIKKLPHTITYLLLKMLSNVARDLFLETNDPPTKFERVWPAIIL